MRSSCILLFLVCYFAKYCFAGSISSGSNISCRFNSNDNQVDEDKAVFDVATSNETQSDISRLNNELNELYALVDEHIQTNYNDDTPGLNSLKTIDIIRKIIDKNATHTLASFSSSCPLYPNANGIYTVNVTGLAPFQILCNTTTAGSGWTVIASRSTGDLSYFRNWSEYKRSFGNLTSEFFVGLDKLHAITATQTHELEKYAMTKLGSYSGDAGDSLTRHAQKKFSTHDNDNDTDSGRNCAIERIGAWWYDNCADSNLFGLYLGGKYSNNYYFKGMWWYNWLGTEYAYKVMHMMVRPKCPCSYASSRNYYNYWEETKFKDIYTFTIYKYLIFKRLFNDILIL